VGLDEKSRGYQVYWLKKRTVTVEQNTYFDGPELLSDHLEEEDYKVIEVPMATSTFTTPATDTALIPTEPEPCVLTPEPPVTNPENGPDDAPHERCICKPTQWVQDLIDGKGVHSNLWNAPLLAQGVQAPSAPVVVERAEFEGRAWQSRS
jgi:hypothetical protein